MSLSRKLQRQLKQSSLSLICEPTHKWEFGSLLSIFLGCFIFPPVLLTPSFKAVKLLLNMCCFVQRFLQ